MKAISEGNESQHVWLERRDVCMGGREGDWKDGGQETVEKIGRERRRMTIREPNLDRYCCFKKTDKWLISL